MTLPPERSAFEGEGSAGHVSGEVCMVRSTYSGLSTRSERRSRVAAIT